MLNDLKITNFAKPVSGLADTPQMTPDELKVWFDSNTTGEVKTAVNALIVYLQTTAAAGEIGAASIPGLTGGTVQALLVALKGALDSQDARVQVTEAHLLNTQNPHAVTKAQVGLGNADNTADTEKPLSSPQKTY